MNNQIKLRQDRAESLNCQIRLLNSQLWQIQKCYAKICDLNKTLIAKAGKKLGMSDFDILCLQLDDEVDVQVQTLLKRALNFKL